MNDFKDRNYSNHLPHYDFGGMYQHITYRLADSLSQDVLRKIEQEVQEEIGDSAQERERR